MIQNETLRTAVMKIMALGTECGTFVVFAQSINALDDLAMQGNPRAKAAIRLVYDFAALAEALSKTTQDPVPVKPQRKKTKRTRSARAAGGVE